MANTTKQERERWRDLHNYAVPHVQDCRIIRLITDLETVLGALDWALQYGTFEVAEDNRLHQAALHEARALLEPQE